MDEKLSMKNGVDFMDKCLDSALNEQRSLAHGAIDMDDWGKAQEILAVAKRNISLIEDLRAKFSEFKNSVAAAEEVIGGGEGVSENNADNAAGTSEKTDAGSSDGDQPNEEFLTQLEELIVEFPFAMAVCNEVAGIGEKFTYDSGESSNMKAPAKLSNSLWVDTAISKSKAGELIAAVREYCVNRG